MSEEVIKKHHWMVAAKVIFAFTDAIDGVPEEAMQAVQVIDLNSVVLSDSTEFPVSMIARAHQSVQMQFGKKMGDAPVAIRDIVLTNLMYLGLMAEPEFNNAPMNQKETDEVEPEKAKPTLSVVENDPADPYAAE